MKQTIVLTFDIEPKAKQSARHCIRGGHIHSYQKGDVVNYENHLSWLAKQQLPPDFQMFTKYVKVDCLAFCFAPLKSFSKAQKKAIDEGLTISKTTKPDLPDNLSKAVFDALSKIVFADDSLIVSMNNVAKFYGKKPYILIQLTGE